MNLSAREGVYYAAWMIGIIITVPIARSMGVHHLIALVIGVAVGFVFGIAAERIYDSRVGDKNSNDSDSDRFDDPRDDPSADEAAATRAVFDALGEDN